MLDPITVGKNIKKYREKLKITQQELATRLYVSYQAVSAWERGVALPDLENTAKLADVFNVKIDALLSNNTSTYLIAVAVGFLLLLILMVAVANMLKVVCNRPSGC